MSNKLAVRDEPLQPGRLLRAIGRDTREWIYGLAAARDEDAEDVLEELLDTHQERTGTLVLEWPVMFPTTGNLAGVARETIRVDLSRTPREAGLDSRTVVPLRGTVALRRFGIDETPWQVDLPLSAFSGRDTVVIRGEPLMVRSDQPQIVVNVPAPVVNVTVEDAPSRQQGEVVFQRDRQGRLVSATLDAIEQPVD